MASRRPFGARAHALIAAIGIACAGAARAEPLASFALDLDAGKKLGVTSSSTKVAVTAPDIVGAKVELNYSARSGASEQESFTARVVRSLDVPFVATTVDARLGQSAADGTNGTLQVRSALPAMDGWKLSTSVVGAYAEPEDFAANDPFKLSDARLKLESGGGRLGLEFGMRQNDDRARWDAAFRRVIAPPLAARVSVTAPIEQDDRYEEGASFRIALERARG